MFNINDLSVMTAFNIAYNGTGLCEEVAIELQLFQNPMSLIYVL
jgi:hypothetical protein